MFFRVLLCIIVIVMPSHLLAAQAEGLIGASILSPRTMDLKTLKKMCKEEPQTTACEVYQEKKFDRKAKKEKSYSVYTGNFQ